jgi:hypothetical protein
MLSIHAHVSSWHLADNPTAPMFVRFWTIADKGGFWLATVCPLMTHNGHSICIAANGYLNPLSK